MRWLPDDVLAHLRAVAQPEPGEPRAHEWLTQRELPAAAAPSARAQVASLSAGEHLGDRFTIEEAIGAGGMGTVYRARDQATGEQVAVKVLHAADTVLAARLEREAAVLAELAHPGIVRSIGWGATSELVFLSMELLEGETLAERLLRGPMAIEEAVEVARAAASALGAAHRAGLVHRDVKPSNIFLVHRQGAKPDVKLLDFGLVRRAGHGASLTREGFVVGTPGYMAPEQARAGSILDARADVFSLACVLYRCLTGVEAFSGDHFAAVLSKVLFDEPTAAESLVPGLPRALAMLLRRMFSKDPAQRPPHAEAVAEALGRMQGPAAPAVDPRAITPAEQRTAWVILAGRSWATAAGGIVAEAPSTDMLSHLRSAVSATGAELEALADGSVVTVLRGDVGPASAATAARVALAVRALLPDASMGLAIGRITAGSTAGEAVDEAARLASRAPESAELRAGVRVDPASARLLEDRFELAEDAAGRIVVCERGRDEPAGVLLGRVSPMVGRDAELTRLTSLYQTCIAAPRARAVVITGAAGIGKSRLARELVRHVRRVSVAPMAGDGRASGEVWIARADPLRAGAAFDLIGQALRSAAGIGDADPLRVRQHKLLARVLRHVTAPQVQRVAEFLGELAGTPFPDVGRLELRAARADAATLRDQLRRAWRDWLTAECGAHPVMILLEDVHWGDLPSLRFVDDALGELPDARLMVVALARPEVTERFPRLWESRGAVYVSLSALAPEATRALALQALGRRERGDDDRAARWVEEHADGNPLAIEELIRAAQGGVPHEGATLPVTLLAVLEARLAALEPTARRLLRAASVFGRAFRAGGVAALVRDLPVEEVDSTLAKLVEREVLLRRGEADASAGDREYAFRHALIRDVAYATLTDQDQRLGHRLAAAWLQRAHGAVPALVLAEHHQRGGMRGRATGFWRRAAEQALAGDDLPVALERAERAIECGARGVSLGALRLIQAEVRRWRGDNAGALQLAREAMDTLPAASSRWYSAIGEAATAAVELDDVGKLRELATVLLSCTWDDKAGGPQIEAAARLTLALVGARELGAADELLARIERVDEGRLRGEPLVLGRVYHARGVRAQVHGDLGQAVDLAQTAYAHFQQAGDRRSAVLSAVTVGDASRELGGYASARVALREALHAALALGLTQVADAARLHLGVVLARTGFLAEAAEVQRAAIVGHRASRNLRAVAAARARLAEVMAMEGGHDEAEAELCAALAELGEGASSRGEILAMLAWVRLRAGRTEPARDAAGKALQALEPRARVAAEQPSSRGDAGGAHAALARLTLAEALQSLGEHGQAVAVVREARDRLLERAARISHELHRQSFLENVPENARTLALSAAWTEPPPPPGTPLR